MPLIEVSSLRFWDWQKWDARPRPSRELDVPKDFGMLGLYLLAASDARPGSTDAPSVADLPEEVIYIGMSNFVERRVERYHTKVLEYRKSYADESCQKLWFSTWQSEWSNDSPSGTVASASLAFCERALILAYADKHGHYPALNCK